MGRKKDAEHDGISAGSSAVVMDNLPVSESAEELQSTESKKDRFVRLANKRMPKLLKMLRQVRNLANRANYDYTEEQAARIMGDLELEIADMSVAFKQVTIEPIGWQL